MPSASTVFRSICFIPCLALLSCAMDPNEKEATDESATTAPQLIGRVASVPSEGGFVLIQKFGATKLPSGTVLTSRGEEDRNANLLVTGESLGQFTAADIRSGQVRTGDGVYSHHIPNPETATSSADLEPESTDSELNTKTGNVQKNN
ncbi:MAG: hypothetical protein KDN05_12055 [Verrucomicrobiae bacterium]|nr:hypothetical protein [Verrucomicrobiae bacterium]